MRGACLCVRFVVGGGGLVPGGLWYSGVVLGGRGGGSVGKKVWRRPLLRVRSPLLKVSWSEGTWFGRGRVEGVLCVRDTLCAWEVLNAAKVASRHM